MNLNELRGEISKKYRTQCRFAQEIGWTPNKMSKLMTGQYKPDTDDVALISEALDLSATKFCKIFMPIQSPNGDKDKLH